MDVDNFINKTGFQKLLRLDEEFDFFRFFSTYKMVIYGSIFVVVVLLIFASQVKQKKQRETLENIDPSVFGAGAKRQTDGLKDELKNLGDFGNLERKMNDQLRGLEDRMSQMSSQFSGIGEIDSIRKQMDEMNRKLRKPDLGE